MQLWGFLGSGQGGQGQIQLLSKGGSLGESCISPCPPCPLKKTLKYISFCYKINHANQSQSRMSSSLHTRLFLPSYNHIF